MADLSNQEKFAFEFLAAPHPENMVLLHGTLKDNPVWVMCWVEDNAIRPLAIVLSDEMIPNINIEGFGNFEKQND